MGFAFMKVCTSCDIEKELSFFNKTKKGKYGVSSVCRKCYLLYKKQYYLKNKEKEKARIKKHRLEKKEYYKEYYQKYNKEYYQKNSEKYKEYFQKNKIKRYLYIKNKKEENPVFKLNMNIRSLIINSFKRGSMSFNKKNKTETILGCSICFFIEYIEDKFTKGMSLDNYGDWHLDHILPISLAENEEDVIKLNHYTNFQPLWAIDNFKKGNKVI